jgi:hypothetical protein
MLTRRQTELGTNTEADECVNSLTGVKISITLRRVVTTSSRH